MPGRISVTREDENGRNQQFHDNVTGRNMSRPEFVAAIQMGQYSNYHIRIVNGIPTPASDPDRSTNNNLG